MFSCFKCYKHTGIGSLILIISLILCGYHPAPSQNWTSGSTGSAKYLDGSTVLVSIFLEDPYSDWDVSEQALVMSKMKIATDYLVSAGTEYGKSVSLTYDIYEHPDLCYTLYYASEINDSDEASYDLLDYVVEYIDDNIPTQQLLSDYGAESIAYMCYINKSGVSYTFPYYEGDSDIYYYEACFMYLTCDGDYEPPAVYAHEILHLFGARDLYASNEYDGITTDFVDYIETNYPNEIMLTTYDADWNNVQDSVTNDLTNITAYFIGWVDTIPELEAFPSIRYKEPACFSETEDDSGNYGSHWGEDASDNHGGHWGEDAADTTASSSSHWGSGSSNAAIPDSDYDSDFAQEHDITLWDVIFSILYYLLS